MTLKKWELYLAALVILGLFFGAGWIGGRQSAPAAIPYTEWVHDTLQGPALVQKIPAKPVPDSSGVFKARADSLYQALLAQSASNAEATEKLKDYLRPFTAASGYRIDTDTVSVAGQIAVTADPLTRDVYHSLTLTHARYPIRVVPCPPAETYSFWDRFGIAVGYGVTIETSEMKAVYGPQLGFSLKISP